MKSNIQAKLINDTYEEIYELNLFDKLFTEYYNIKDGKVISIDNILNSYIGNKAIIKNINDLNDEQINKQNLIKLMNNKSNQVPLYKMQDLKYILDNCIMKFKFNNSDIDTNVYNYNNNSYKKIKASSPFYYFQELYNKYGFIIIELKDNINLKNYYLQIVYYGCISSNLIIYYLNNILQMFNLNLVLLDNYNYFNN